MEYEVFGARGGSAVVQGDVADLLEAIPYLLPPGLIPSRPALNDIVARGERDAGMSGGCRWAPFHLSPRRVAFPAPGAGRALGALPLGPPARVGDELP